MSEDQRWNQLGGTDTGVAFADGPLRVIISPGYGVEKRIDKAAVALVDWTVTSPIGGQSKRIVQLIVRSSGGFLKKATETRYDLRQYQTLRQGRRVFSFVPKDDAPDTVHAVAFEVTSDERVKPLRRAAGAWLEIEEMSK